MLRVWHRKNIYIYYYLGYSIIVMDSSSKFFFSFSVKYVMIVKLVDFNCSIRIQIVKLFPKIFNRKNNQISRGRARNYLGGGGGGGGCLKICLLKY